MRLSLAVFLAGIAIGGCAATAVPVPPVGQLVILEHQDSAGAQFLGSSACRACHAEAYARWRSTGHAREFAGLPSADRLASACLRCHTTGYGDSFGFQPAGDARDLGNVGCEACHGPGADHGRSTHPELVPTLTGGACPPCEINRICRLCHTPEQSVGFDLSPALKKITCKP